MSTIETNIERIISVNKLQGVSFCECIGDVNPLHKGKVVPGMFVHSSFIHDLHELYGRKGKKYVGQKTKFRIQIFYDEIFHTSVRPAGEEAKLEALKGDKLAFEGKARFSDEAENKEVSLIVPPYNFSLEELSFDKAAYGRFCDYVGCPDCDLARKNYLISKFSGFLTQKETKKSFFYGSHQLHFYQLPDLSELDSFCVGTKKTERSGIIKLEVFISSPPIGKSKRVRVYIDGNAFFKEIKSDGQ